MFYWLNHEEAEWEQVESMRSIRVTGGRRQRA